MPFLVLFQSLQSSQDYHSSSQRGTSVLRVDFSTWLASPLHSIALPSPSPALLNVVLARAHQSDLWVDRPFLIAL